MKKLSKVILLMIFTSLTGQDYLDNKGTIGKINDSNISNVNSGVNHWVQNVKRSSAMLFFPKRRWENEGENHNHTSSVTVINTVNNSFINNENKSVYILMAAHNFGYEVRNEPYLNNDIRVGNEVTFYISFDYESPRAIEPNQENRSEYLQNLKKHTYQPSMESFRRSESL